MGGDDSQKLLPWRGMILLSGAQTSGLLRIQHCSGKLGGLGNLPLPPLARSGLNYRRPGSLLASRPGSLLPRAEGSGRGDTLDSLLLPRHICRQKPDRGNRPSGEASRIRGAADGCRHPASGAPVCSIVTSGKPGVARLPGSTVLVITTSGFLPRAAIRRDASAHVRSELPHP